MRAYGIVAMIMLALSVVFDLIAVFGTAKVKPRFSNTWLLKYIYI